MNWCWDRDRPDQWEKYEKAREILCISDQGRPKCNAAETNASSHLGTHWVLHVKQFSETRWETIERVFHNRNICWWRRCQDRGVGSVSDSALIFKPSQIGPRYDSMDNFYFSCLLYFLRFTIANKMRCMLTTFQIFQHGGNFTVGLLTVVYFSWI